jgi:hypothetical protein
MKYQRFTRRGVMIQMAANKGGGSGGKAAAGTGTGTGTDTKPATKEKVKVEVHAGLAKLAKEHDAAADKAASVLVEMCELMARDNISNPVAIKTFMEVRGVSEASAKSQVSRMRSLMKDKESLQALKDGQVTVRAAVKGAQARRAPSAANNAKKLDNAINNLVTCAKAAGQDKKTILTTIEAALDKGGIK